MKNVGEENIEWKNQDKSPENKSTKKYEKIGR